MKKKLVIIAVTILITGIAAAQQTGKAPSAKWIPRYGYWVIETNLGSPKSSTIFFYNNQDVLVYTEKVDGVKLNVKRPKTLKKLKEALDESLLAWKQEQSLQGGQLVKNIFREGK